MDLMGGSKDIFVIQLGIVFENFMRISAHIVYIRVFRLNKL